MEPIPKGLERLGKDFTIQILMFLPYSDIMELFFVSRQFGQLQNDPQLFRGLLEEQFGVPLSKNADFKEYYHVLKRVLNRLKQAYLLNSAQNIAQNLNLSKIELQLYPKIRKEQSKYQKVDIDLRFLMVRSLSETIEDRLVFGGIIYYHQRQFYMTFKDQQIDIEGLPLYPQVMLEYNVLLSDFDNKVGFGSQQKYLMVGIDDQGWTLIKWNQNYLEKGIKRDNTYYDYFDTLQNPKSDFTTRGIRIRTDSRLVPSDDRFRYQSPFFSYQVRFSDDGSSEKGAKLVSRRWVIHSYDANGQVNTQVVEGEGVIGYYPHIYKGCEDFIYQSCSGIEGVRGVMQGHFVFKDVQTKEDFLVEIKPFVLNFGPHVAYMVERETFTVRELV